ncbi:MAG: formyltetrahydrofolate deformylase [Solirubrobacteraceae bacterium]|jgi:formyltetrahydrofolate deformylase|nr:formyltetrahydrofolate deformylase [Solirubrobacteraceae bacterium]
MDGQARLLISCPDGPGIVAAVSTFLFERGANIDTSDQHSTDPAGGRFFMRMTFTLDADDAAWAELERDFGEQVAAARAMDWRLARASGPRRLALLASGEDHCLLDLLWRASRGELPAEVATVISNHESARRAVEGFGVPFVHVPVSPDTKPQSEAAILAALAEARADTVVLARYMQILSANFLEQVGAPVINIHHSFLPAFAGADPYRRAMERGVKIIGATAHYVTEELDAGPIIEQDVVRVSHRAGVAELTRMGADIERLVLARAVRWHLEDRVLVDEGRTIVFV